MACALIFVSNIGGSQSAVIGANRSSVHPRTLQWFLEGLYAEPVRVWRALFPREQLLLLTTEELMEQPREELLRLFEHIGVGDVSGAHHVSADCRRGFRDSVSCNGGCSSGGEGTSPC